VSIALVSVVIPCYNHARFLPEAVASVKNQSYTHTEIIVVDDGSTDDTKAVCESLPGVRYVYQSNSGLSAARNTGFKHSTGDYIVFLDADDYLFPKALEANVAYLENHTGLAFVSGRHDKVDARGKVIPEDQHDVIHSDHYIHLLQGNYIGMHATVMYTRWILEQFEFDTTLKACEDYDMYFRITRKHPVGNHAEKIAAYRIHGNNMSANIPFMLEMALKVQGQQKEVLKDSKEKEAFENGIKIWTAYYSHKLFQELKEKVMGSSVPEESEFQSLKKLSPAYAAQLRKTIMKQKIKRGLKKSLPNFILRVLHQKGIVQDYQPSPGKISWGDLERTKPFSTSFGYDRGGPVDRYYIEKFLTENNALIKGRAFEIGDNAYTMQFGGTNIKQSDVLHVYQANDTVTFIGDLTDAPQIPSDAFDCIILTQTLHLIYDFKSALKTCHRILKPGGTLLLTVPGITHIDHDEWKDYWLWAFTTTSMKKVFEETFPGAQVEVKNYGNVYVATSFLYGMGLPEVKKEFLDFNDPCYQVIISVKATKQ
jgi:glycosyltransferase involved in cell wall biosynthesis/SAM-dependent methyltransferase